MAESLPVIRSGGQTGVDRAALDAAMQADFPVTGWCPRGRRAEDGTIPERYPLQPTLSPEYGERTRLNIVDSDATLVLAPELLGGTAYTVEIAVDLGKPLLVTDPFTGDPARVVDWMMETGLSDLNVAGPRESEVPGIYHTAREFFSAVLESYRRLS
jgi:predicted Rossmann fold nucleotide-binding protein DprA/Smf involved in DNA uptake